MRSHGYVYHAAKDNKANMTYLGASGFVHVASVLNFSPNPSEVIPHVIKGTLEGLQSAAKEPKMKRFVLTSSSTAAQAPIPNKEYNIDETTWNDLFVEQANAPPPYEMDRAYAVYGASKVAGEKAMWDFVKEKRPHFVANSSMSFPYCMFTKMSCS